MSYEMLALMIGQPYFALHIQLLSLDNTLKVASES